MATYLSNVNSSKGITSRWGFRVDPARNISRRPILRNHQLQGSRQGSQSHGLTKNDCRLQKLTYRALIISKESILSEVLVSTPRKYISQNHSTQPSFQVVQKGSMFYKRSLESRTLMKTLKLTTTYLLGDNTLKRIYSKWGFLTDHNEKYISRTCTMQPSSYLIFVL